MLKKLCKTKIRIGADPYSDNKNFYMNISIALSIFYSQLFSGKKKSEALNPRATLPSFLLHEIVEFLYLEVFT
jgi:hypothetical protein